MSRKISTVVNEEYLSKLFVQNEWYILSDGLNYYIPLGYYMDNYLKLTNESIIQNTPIYPIGYNYCNCSIYLRDYQQDISNIFDEYMMNYFRCFVFCRPAFGKTMFSIYKIYEYINKNMLPGYILIICDLKKVLKQWENVIAKYTDLQFSRVKGHSNTSIYSKIILSTTVMTDHLSMDIINNISLMIIDEIDISCTDARRNRLLKISPTYLVGLSATKNRSDGKDILINFMFSDKVIEVSFPPVNVKYFRTNEVLSMRGRTKGDKWRNYLTDIMNNNRRNTQICIMLYNFFTGAFLPDNNKMFIFCRSNMAIKILSDYIIEFYRNNGYFIMNEVKSIQEISHENKTVKTELYEYFEIHGTNLFIRVCIFCAKIDFTREADITITNDKIGGRGIDEINLCENHSGIKTDTCLFYQSMKNPSTYIQAIGRILRSPENASIIHILDKHPISKTHFDENMKCLANKNMIKSIEYINY